MTHFAHNSNTRNDERVVALRMKLGAAGYGIYIMLIEKMHENADFSLTRDYKLLAYDIHAGIKKIRSVVEDFGLFEFSADGTRFTSAPQHRANVEKPSDNDAPATAEAAEASATDVAEAETEGDKACEAKDESTESPSVDDCKSDGEEYTVNYDDLLFVLRSPSYRSDIKRLSKVYDTTPDQVLACIAEVIAEWKISQPRHSNYNELYCDLLKQAHERIERRRNAA